jgi:hypothetical protein
MKPSSQPSGGAPSGRRGIDVAKCNRPSRKRLALHKLSAEFLSRERHGYLVREALIFIAIVVLCTWPMVSLAEAMAHAFP